MVLVIIVFLALVLIVAVVVIVFVIVFIDLMVIAVAVLHLVLIIISIAKTLQTIHGPDASDVASMLHPGVKTILMCISHSYSFSTTPSGQVMRSGRGEGMASDAEWAW